LPTIAYFLGIAVRMYFNDHDPPHFHVRYQGFRARIGIADGEIIDGRLPKTVARVLREWTALRHDALMQNRTAARTDGRLEQIAGPE
jgi:hypothetical protein